MRTAADHKHVLGDFGFPRADVAPAFVDEGALAGFDNRLKDNPGEFRWVIDDDGPKPDIDGWGPVLQELDQVVRRRIAACSGQHAEATDVDIG